MNMTDEVWARCAECRTQLKEGDEHRSAAVAVIVWHNDSRR